MTDPTPEQIEEALKNVELLIDRQKTLPAEAAKALTDNFWNLYEPIDKPQMDKPTKIHYGWFILIAFSLFFIGACVVAVVG